MVVEWYETTKLIHGPAKIEAEIWLGRVVLGPYTEEKEEAMFKALPLVTWIGSRFTW
jgi:hypothetical protein